MVTFKELIASLRPIRYNKNVTEEFHSKIIDFVESNEVVANSENYRNSEADDFNTLAQALSRFLSPINKHKSLVLLTLKALKILSRKEKNRLNISQVSFELILKFLDDVTSWEIASEAANLILNLCYEKKNVHLALSLNTVDILEKALFSKNEHLQTNSAGALQSICFQDVGRKAVLRDSSCLKRLVHLTSSPNVRVRLRSVSALHNISSDQKAIQAIRRVDGIPRLVRILQTENEEALKGSVAGCVQNLSREAASRLLIKQLGAVEDLAALLSSSDVQAQVCSAGALVNILASSMTPCQRTRFCKVISDLLTISAVKSSL